MTRSVPQSPTAHIHVHISPQHISPILGGVPLHLQIVSTRVQRLRTQRDTTVSKQFDACLCFRITTLSRLDYLFLSSQKLV